MKNTQHKPIQVYKGAEILIHVNSDIIRLNISHEPMLSPVKVSVTTETREEVFVLLNPNEV